MPATLPRADVHPAASLRIFKASCLSARRLPAALLAIGLTGAGLCLPAHAQYYGYPEPYGGRPGAYGSPPGYVPLPRSGVLPPAEIRNILLDMGYRQVSRAQLQGRTYVIAAWDDSGPAMLRIDAFTGRVLSARSVRGGPTIAVPSPGPARPPRVAPPRGPNVAVRPDPSASAPRSPNAAARAVPAPQAPASAPLPPQRPELASAPPVPASGSTVPAATAPAVPAVSAPAAAAPAASAAAPSATPASPAGTAGAVNPAPKAAAPAGAGAVEAPTAAVTPAAKPAANPAPKPASKPERAAGAGTATGTPSAGAASVLSRTAPKAPAAD